MSEVIQPLSVSRISPLTHKVTAAGTKVIDRIIAAISARTTVKAIGWNIFASIPLKAKIGKYTTKIISCPKIRGRRACRAAKNTSLNRSLCVNGRLSNCCAWARRRIQFSTITTAPSTIIPKSSAPRLIKLALIFFCAIPVKVNSMESGITQAVIRAARIFPKNKNSITITSTAPSTRFFCTVLIAFSTRDVRS